MKRLGLLIFLILLGILILGFGLWLLSLYAICWAPKRVKKGDGWKGPIDVVYTWVDGTDEAWREAQEDWREREGLGRGDPQRDPTPDLLKDELYFSIRSVLRFMPWVRTIYIFTQKPQRPKWLPFSKQKKSISDDCLNPIDPLFDKVKVVHHEDVFRPYAPLPSYNGLLNYSQVHHIPNLSEHFILFDDDFFVGRPLEPYNFFDGKGRPVYKLTVPLGMWVNPSCMYSKIMKHTHRLSRSLLGCRWMVSTNHTPVALRKKDCLEIEDVLKESGHLQTMQRFRQPTTIEFPFLVMNHALKKGDVLRPPKGYTTKFVNRRTYPTMKALFAKGLPHTWCINSGFNQAMSELFIREKQD